jgi:hypothetical protein
LSVERITPAVRADYASNERGTLAAAGSYETSHPVRQSLLKSLKHTFLPPMSNTWHISDMIEETRRVRLPLPLSK